MHGLEGRTKAYRSLRQGVNDLVDLGDLCFCCRGVGPSLAPQTLKIATSYVYVRYYSWKTWASHGANEKTIGAGEMPFASGVADSVTVRDWALLL